MSKDGLVIKELYSNFPNLLNEYIIIRRMSIADSESLFSLCNNDATFKYSPHFLYKKSLKQIQTAITTLGDRDFQKKKYIIAGVYLASNPDKLVGLAEIFDYNKRLNRVTIGYKVQESEWGKGIATNIVKLISEYLLTEIGIARIEALVMKDNVASKQALLKNGFKFERLSEKEHEWNGHGLVDLEVYSLLQWRNIN